MRAAEKGGCPTLAYVLDNLPLINLLHWHQFQRTFRIFLDHASFKKHGMMFHLQPWFDKVRVVLAANLARLSRSMARKRGFQICQVHNLSIGWYDYDYLWLVMQ